MPKQFESKTDGRPVIIREYEVVIFPEGEPNLVHEPRRLTLSYTEAEAETLEATGLRAQTEAFRRAVKLERKADPTVADLEFDVASVRLVRQRLVTGSARS